MKLIAKLLPAVLCLAAGSTPAEELIRLAPGPEAPQEVVFTPETGKPACLRFYRSLWQALQVKTDGGKTINLTDLLFYSTLRDGKPTDKNEYWSKPESWDAQLKFKPLGKADDGGESILIEGKRDGYIKQLFLTVYPGEKVVYVVNRLRVDEPGKYQDVQNYYMNTDQTHPEAVAELVLDGKALPLNQTAFANQSAILYLEKKDATLGVLLAPRSEQKYRIHKRAGMIRFEPHKNNAASLQLQGFYEQNLSKGDLIELRYAIAWDDGMKIDEFTKLAEKMQKGELNSRFHAE